MSGRSCRTSCNPRCNRRLVVAVAAAGAVLHPVGSLAAASPAPTGTPAGASAPAAGVRGAVLWIAVSPAYRRTGLVLASVSEPGCTADCLSLWASHDGGASWRRSTASGWGRGRFYIASALDGHDVVFGESSTGLQRSDDSGAGWRTVGPTGIPAVSSGFSRDATVAVAVAASSSADYLLRDTTASAITGSNGAWTDLGFMLSPSFPAQGRYAPVLLSAGDRTTDAPVVEQCDLRFTCHGAVTLPDAGAWALPVALSPSTAYAEDGTVFARAGRSIYKSTNGARVFAPLAVLPDDGASTTAYPALALAPGYTETGDVRTVYSAVLRVTADSSAPAQSRSTGGIYRSPDGGSTWSRLGSPSPLDTGASALAVAPDGRLFAGYVGGPRGAAGLLCSTDGVRWEASCAAVLTAGSARQPSGRTPAPARDPAGCATACAALHAAAATAGDAPNSRRARAAARSATFPVTADVGGGSLSQLVWLIGLAVLLVGSVALGSARRRPAPPLPGRRALRGHAPASRCPGSRPEHADPRNGRNTHHAEQVSSDKIRPSG